MSKVPGIPVAYSSTASSNVKASKTGRRRTKYFFVGMAILFPVIAFLGFFPSALMMNEGFLKVHWLTHVHSMLMTTWLLLFFTQTILAVTGNLKYHRRLGRLSVALAVLIVIMMMVVSFNLIIAHRAPEGSFTFDLLIGGFYEMFGFALFFTWGMLSRKKNMSAHKRLMTMAGIVLLEAAVDRIQLKHAFPSFGLAYPATNFIYADILYIPLFLYDWITIKRVHKATLVGTAIIITCQILVCTFYGSPSWHKFWYAQTAPLMEKVVEIKLTENESAPLLGHYESKIGKISISRANDKLYVQFNGGEKQELGAISPTALFLRQETMQFSFVMGPAGKITYAQAEQIGRTYKMTRLP